MSDTYLTRETLLKQIRHSNSDQAWDDFVGYYRGFISSILRKLGIQPCDHDDLLQKILLKLWKKLPDFDYNQQKGAFRSWLYVITKNTVYNYTLQQQNRSAKYDEIQNIAVTDSKKSDIDKVIEAEWKRHISTLAFRNISKRISETTLEAFHATVRGESIEDIAKRLQISEASVYKYKNRVKEKLIEEINCLRDMLE